MELKHITGRIAMDDYNAMVALAKDDKRKFNQILGFACREYVEKHAVKKHVNKKATRLQK